MKPQLSPSQGRVVRALVATLSFDGKQMLTPGDAGGFVLEAMVSQPWASLTFAGERHHLVGRLPGGSRPVAIDSDRLAVPGAIVAVEAAVWDETADATRLTLDLLTLGGDRAP